MSKWYSLLILFSVSVPIFANPTCSGTVSGVSLAHSGNVHASITNGSSTKLTNVVFCNINSTESTNFSGETCKGILSLLTSASAMDASATIWFQSSSFESCTLSWKSLKNYGFYHFKVNL